MAFSIKTGCFGRKSAAGIGWRPGVGEGKKHNEMFTRRAAMLLSGQLGVMGLLACKLYGLQISQGNILKNLAWKNRTNRLLLPPPRGCIFDRSGTILGDNRMTWRALVLPHDAGDLDQVIANFDALIPLDERDQIRIARERRHMRKYVPITLKEYLSWEEMAHIELNANRLPGIIVDAGTSRFYPEGELTAHLVGYVAPPAEADLQKDILYALPGMRIGRGGIEQTQEELLRGEAGLVEEKVNAQGRVLGEMERQRSMPGKDVVLTLDLPLQESIRSRLADRVASAVVLDVNGGQVMGMVSTPSFDPGSFDSGVSPAQWHKWIADPRTPLVNKAVSGLYPPGSTFKPAVALAGLHSGVINPEEYLNCPGYYDMGGVRFHCWNRYGHGSVNMRQALKYSCDVYFYQLARRSGMEAIKHAAQMMGLGVRSPIELPHVGRGVVPTPEWRRKKGFHWNGGDTVNAGIGQGFVQVTPLELATYAASIASGKMVRPSLIHSVTTGLEPPGKEAVTQADLPFSTAHLEVVRGGMFAVVNEPHGTAPLARLAGLKGVLMAGKTGSAQVRHVSRALRESGHFNSMELPWEYRPHALFICYAPYGQPRYAVALVIEHGNAGAKEAAPLARQIMEDALRRDPLRFAPKPDFMAVRQGYQGRWDNSFPLL